MQNNFHDGEICGLKWSFDKKFLASGSNDNSLKIWQIGTNVPRNNINSHKSAVKAIAWCPWKNGVSAREVKRMTNVSRFGIFQMMN
ncbi:ubiquitin-protein transferase activating protein [Gurleya vavrai]